MKKEIPLFFFLSFFLFFGGCGKKGPIYPPVAKIPQKIQSFHVFQKGKSFVLNWENPQSYTDGRPLPGISEAEIWLLSNEKEKGESSYSPTIQKFKQRAERIASIQRKNFLEYQMDAEGNSSNFRYVYSLRAKEFLSHIYIFGMRIKDTGNNKSPFSELKVVEPQIVSLPPESLQGNVSEEGIELEWKSPEKNIDLSSPPELEGYNVYRAEEEDNFSRINSQLIPEENYKDTDIILGTLYRYFVRASAAKSSPYLESDDSNTLKIHARDKFPPESPQKVKAIVGKDTVALSWKANQEKDLKGYHVWRKKKGKEEYELLTPEPVQENAFIDSTVEMNQRYDYAITALDQSGNESPRSQSVFVELEEHLNENLSL